MLLITGFSLELQAQVPDSLKLKSDTARVDTSIRTDSSFTIQQVDTVLRIRNLNPYITLSTDSTLDYELMINKDVSKYYWFLRNSPPGVQINRKTGILHLKAEKALFL
ncbi:MAG: hypothetical protein J0I84_01400, partial [Terrimonas sp.]|nr:hypothetical protein [Terrimonas sp.]